MPPLTIAIEDETIPFICEDFSLFKRTLQESRALDDNVIPKLNALTTRSADVKQSCRFFEQSLNVAYRERERLISRCLRIRGDKLAEKRAHLEARPDDADLRNSLLLEESQRSAVQREFTVEEILRERTHSVFQQRCLVHTTIRDFWKVQQKMD
ncbi:caffeine-induced death protein 2 [Powellomyces hirtus]|nr:caffeine-induced death protein 2 [Powellomyces hirtus]